MNCRGEKPVDWLCTTTRKQSNITIGNEAAQTSWQDLESDARTTTIPGSANQNLTQNAASPVTVQSRFLFFFFLFLAETIICAPKPDELSWTSEAKWNPRETLQTLPGWGHGADGGSCDEELTQHCHHHTQPQPFVPFSLCYSSLGLRPVLYQDTCVCDSSDRWYLPLHGTLRDFKAP